jgi:peptide deformylase
MFEVRDYPDPVLLKRAKPVTQFNRKLERFVEEMFETMYEEKGVGLAAPQVGVSARVLVINCEWEEKGSGGEIAMINPEITAHVGTEERNEGCLSFPGIYAKVDRHHVVKARYQDVKGAWHEIEAEGFLAQAIQHEIDHLEGRVFVELLKPDQLALVAKEIEQLKREWKRNGGKSKPAPAEIL